MPAKNIGKTLKEIRLKTGISQKQAYEYIGVVQSTFSSWETGKAEPPTEVVLKLCDLYQVDDILSTFGYDGYKEDGSLQLNMKEIDMVENYRSLDKIGKERIDYELKRECERVKEIRDRDKKIKELESEIAEELVPYSYLGNIACAGTGFYFDDIPTEIIKAPYAEGADFIIGVSGESMDPDYHDGEKLYVKKTEYLRIGDVGIFTINNQCFLKELGSDGLISKNENYNDIPGDENVRLIGKVIGKVEED